MKKQQWVILKGEGANQHVIEGDFTRINEKEDRFSEFVVNADGCIVHHQDPFGQFAEHNPLPLAKGRWFQCRQVEVSPFDGTMNDIWD